MLRLTDYRTKNKFAIPEHQVTTIEQPVDESDGQPRPFRIVWALTPMPLPKGAPRPPGMLTNFTVILNPYEVEESYESLCNQVGARPHPQTLNFG